MIVMKRYLYCIHYSVVDRTLQHPEVRHAWFESPPGDLEILRYLELVEMPFPNSKIKPGFYYYLVFDRTEDLIKLGELKNE